MSGEATGDELWSVTRPGLDEHQRGGWYEFQCLHCRFYHELRGRAGADWGVCFNPESIYAGMLKFEHQGCPKWQDEIYDSPEEEEISA